jgi:phage FluMu protein Com
MARYIHCEKCNREMAASAKEFGELYESIPGKPIGNLRCDGCGKDLPSIATCYAAVLLDNKSNHIYKYQKPEFWMKDFITTEPVNK